MSTTEAAAALNWIDEAYAADVDVPTRILGGACAVFLANGFSGATTDMIQVATGASKATIYRHFASKEILFEAVMTAKCHAFYDELGVIVSDEVGLEAKLKQIGLRFIGVLFSDSALSLLRLVIAESHRFPQLGELFWRVGPKALAEMVARRLAEAQAAGEIRPLDVEAAADQFISMIRGELHLRCLMRQAAAPSDEEMRAHVERSVGGFLAIYR